MTTDQLNPFVNLIIAAVPLGCVIYALYLISKTLVNYYEHHLWGERVKKYHRWLADYEERKDRMSKEEFEEVMDYLHDITLGGNKDMRGPWENLP